ncbi:MAG TPA: DUF3606 domain-containing protein [Casimicrobiaceae bacterium]|nr:DUF3606 domain-containing protein [Casimicrobiaceae bacterium]
MSDEDSHRGAPDRVHLEEDYEKHYWMKILGASEDALTEAVHEVGHSVRKVREYLHPERIREYPHAERPRR